MWVEQICDIHIVLYRILLNSANFVLLFNIWSLYIPLILGARIMYLMDVFHNYRWLVIPVDRPKVSAVKWQWISAATATTTESGRANGHANWIASSASARAVEFATPTAAWRTWWATSGLPGILWYSTSAVQPDWWIIGCRCLDPYYWVQVCLASSTLC